ncbi:hypothetical protein DSL92_08720 [Billgrantia gudaonensis]|uniref:Uncharacterized protein n=1 Tax=Billgrantia gudaonensis TaxID=376427 RepID=A0A3S0R4F4_9GAMM|nr:hypothetical protein DSL92_08720 [Halomonas gudaonensis]
MDRDYLTIVEAGAPEGSHLDYTRTQRGSPRHSSRQMPWVSTKSAMCTSRAKRPWPVSRSP